MSRLVGLPPLWSAGTRLLVLGSFPSARSLAEGQYYGHPRNQFWPLLQSLWPEHPGGHAPAGQPPIPYADRCAWLLARGVGLWDVYGACEREGSLDTAIRHAEPNDLRGLQQACPALVAIVHNGGESGRHAVHTRATGLPVHVLPSTSPAHAAWSLARKAEAWRAVFAQHGLVAPAAQPADGP